MQMSLKIIRFLFRFRANFYQPTFMTYNQLYSLLHFYKKNTLCLPQIAESSKEKLKIIQQLIKTILVQKSTMSFVL